MTSESASLIVLKSINNKLQELIDVFKIKDLVNKTLADYSKDQPRESSGKPMPEIIGNYTIAEKGCNRCGGKISWDNYSKDVGGQNYPDHIDDDGNITDCPEYN